MDQKTADPAALALRAQLMAADPMQRAMALHAIELELSSRKAASTRSFAKEVENFTARGIPFYAPEDQHFRDWVARAVAYWERLRRGGSGRRCGAAA